jgi:hypothetical protein
MKMYLNPMLNSELQVYEKNSKESQGMRIPKFEARVRCFDLCETFCGFTNIRGELDFCKKKDTFLKGPILGHTDPQMQYFKYCDVSWPVLELRMPCCYEILLKDEAIISKTRCFICILLGLQISSSYFVVFFMNIEIFYFIVRLLCPKL